MHGDQAPVYTDDLYAWLAHNAQMLREGRLSALDTLNVAEELEDIGRSQRRAVMGHLRVLLIHLLKWQYQPKLRSPSWRLSIRSARDQIEGIIDDSPSLGRQIPEFMEREYLKARKYAADETGLPIETFPQTPAFTVEQILDEEFLPDA